MTELDDAIRDAGIAASDPQTASKGRKAWDSLATYLETLRPSQPPPPPPPPSTDADKVFQSLWDGTKMPAGTWNPVKTASSATALTAALAGAKPNDHIRVSGFTYGQRLALRGVIGPLWLECDPSFQVIGPKGVYGQGFWLVDCKQVYITGFPQATGGNEGLLDQGSQGCYFELEVRNAGGSGILVNKATKLPAGNVYKLRGGGCGDDLNLDPHAQKGTGNHFANAWQAETCTFLVDVDQEQKWGNGFESTWLKACHIAVRATNLSCDVDKIPPAPGPPPFRQTAGNAWCPWDASNTGPHTDCTVEVISAGRCSQGVYGALSNPGNKGNVVKLGRVGSHFHSPVWAKLPGVTYQDVQPTP
jgi:hypothetical protein